MNSRCVRCSRSENATRTDGRTDDLMVDCGITFDSTGYSCTRENGWLKVVVSAFGIVVRRRRRHHLYIGAPITDF